MNRLLLIATFLLFGDVSAQKKGNKPKATYNTTVHKPKNVIVKDGDVKVDKADNINVTVYSNGLQEKLYDKETAINSIPVVTAKMFKDAIPKELDNGEFTLWERQATGKYLRYLDVTNVGDYKLLDVNISLAKYPQFRSLPEVKKFEQLNLLPKEKHYLDTLIHCDINPDSTKSEDDLYYVGEQEELPITITVQWDTSIYFYTYKMIGNATPELKIDDSYTYKGIRYNRQEFIDIIYKERQEIKKKLMKANPERYSVPSP